jgi:Na+-driven multidrug efflux pump
MIVVVWRTLNARRERLHLGGPPARAPWWDRQGWKHILDIGLPPQIARIAMFVAYTYLIQRVARDGKADVVGFGLGLTILYFAINLSGAVGRATAIALGQAVGARDFDRGRRVLRIGFGLGTAIGVVVLGALVVFAPQLVGVFVDEPTMVSRGVQAQLLLFAFTAVKASKRAGLAGIFAEVLGVVFILAWPGDSQLVGAAWSICLSNAARAVAFMILGRTVIGRALRPSS